MKTETTKTRNAYLVLSARELRNMLKRIKINNGGRIANHKTIVLGLQFAGSEHSASDGALQENSTEIFH